MKKEEMKVTDSVKEKQTKKKVAIIGGIIVAATSLVGIGVALKKKKDKNKVK